MEPIFMCHTFGMCKKNCAECLSIIEINLKIQAAEPIYNEYDINLCNLIIPDQI